MTEKIMTLSEAISLKKSLKRKIDKRLLKLKLAYMAVGTDEYKSHKADYDDYSARIRSTYQSLKVIKTNYDILSAAILTANAKTKTDLNDPDGNPYTICQLLCMLSDDTDDIIAKTINDSWARARAKQAGHKDIIVLDPFDKRTHDDIQSNEEFKEQVKAAIAKANSKKKIKVSFID